MACMHFLLIPLCFVAVVDLSIGYITIVRKSAAILQVTMDIVANFFNPDSCHIHLNHGDLLDAIWSWIGVKAEHRQKVAEVYH